MTVGKPLKDATRDDGRKLVAAFGDVKSATAKRKMVPLVAMVNLAISENKLPPFNPFGRSSGFTRSADDIQPPVCHRTRLRCAPIPCGYRS